MQTRSCAHKTSGLRHFVGDGGWKVHGTHPGEVGGPISSSLMETVRITRGLDAAWGGLLHRTLCVCTAGTRAQLSGMHGYRIGVG